MQVTVQDVSKRFGGLQALSRVSLVARSGEVTAVIGPNGAGKSTLINCLTGMASIDAGHVIVDGQEYTALSPSTLIERGITRTFQNLRLFENLTVIEQLILARRGYLRSTRAKQRKHGKIEDDCLALLRRVGLDQKRDLRPDELSYGERRRLEIARGLATEPHLLLLDEPAAGFMLSEQASLAILIKEIAASGVAIILVEHHMDLVAEVSNQVVVLNFGEVILTGTIQEVRKDERVIAAYLGVSAH